jgi:hypothetical protein
MSDHRLAAERFAVFLSATTMIAFAGISAYYTIEQRAWIDAVLAIGVPIFAVRDWLRSRSRPETRDVADRMFGYLVLLMLLAAGALWR